MSATDELRRLLDELGVKYYDMQNRGIWFGISEDGKDHKYEAFEQIDGLIEIEVYDLTPEQAIAATLLTPEIVRCRDCANYHDGISQYTGRRFAEPHCLAIGELAYGALFEVDENDFCSWAERRER